MPYVAKNPSEEKAPLRVDSNGSLVTSSVPRLVLVSASLTRPDNTTQYSVGDAITDSASAPTVFQLNLGALGASAGSIVIIRELHVISSAKQGTLPLINAFLSNATFTSTNDNAALDIADATIEALGVWAVCTTQAFTASNSRVSHLNLNSPITLATADTKLYGILSAANTYTPVSEEKFTIKAWVELL